MRAYTHALPSIRSVVRKNDFGQLGRDLDDASSSSFTGRVMRNAVAGACGLYHTLLMDTDGTLFSFGKGGGGRLGNGTEEDVYFPHPSFRLDDDITLKSISSGAAHNALVTSDGEIYSWGFDSHGQAGCRGGGLMHDEDRSVLRPSPVLLNEDVKFTQVSCGGFHTLACDDQGQVYAWGRSEYGRCGLLPPRQEEDGGGGGVSHLEDDAELPIWQPQLVPTVQQIASVTSGAFCSLLVHDSKREMFAFGGNENGELGCGKRSKFEVSPQRVKLALRPDETIATVASGGFHSVVLTSQGRVLGFGSNQGNPLGLGDKFQRSQVPIELFTNKLLDGSKVVQVACGPKYTLVVTERQELWMFGGGGPKPKLLHTSKRSSSSIKLPPQQGLHHVLFFEQD